LKLVHYIRLYCFVILSINRSEQGLELDLFLLQCCAALAPEDLFVSRILERFGLSNYLSLNLERSSEYVLSCNEENFSCMFAILKCLNLPYYWKLMICKFINSIMFFWIDPFLLWSFCNFSQSFVVSHFFYGMPFFITSILFNSSKVPSFLNVALSSYHTPFTNDFSFNKGFLHLQRANA